MEINEIKIDKHIPIPSMVKLYWEKLALRMEIGDSVWLPSAKDKVNLRHAHARKSRRTLCRKENNGYRVWRVE